MKIHYIIGDATLPEIEGNKYICHVCNNIGAWGAGFVLALSKKWPEPEREYRALNKYKLGNVQYVKVEDDITVANMIAQNDKAYPFSRDKDGNEITIPPIRYGAVRACLADVNDKAYKENATIHMPRIGCGLAGGKWNEIEKIINDVCTVDVYVYDLK